MANIIDSLSIELGLDISKFKRSQQEVLDGLKQIKDASDDSSESITSNNFKTIGSYEKLISTISKVTGETHKLSTEEKKTGEQSSKIAKEGHLNNTKNIDGISKAISGVRALAVSYLALRAIKKAIEITDEVGTVNAEAGRKSTMLGTPSADLQAWGNVAKAVGGSEKDITGSLQSIQSAITAFITNGASQDAIVALNRFEGLAAEDLDKFDIVAEKIKIYIDKLKQAGFDDTRAIQMAFKYASDLGYNESTFSMVLLGKDRLAALKEEAKGMLHVTPGLTAASIEYKIATARLSTALEGLGNVVGGSMLTSFTKLIDLLVQAISFTSDLYDNSIKFLGNTSVFKAISEAVFGPPKESEIETSGSPITNKNSKENAKRLMDYYKSQGLDEEHAAALVGNAMHESAGLNPNKSSTFTNPKTGKVSEGYGLFQWGTDRQKDFQNKYHKSIKGSSLEEQADFSLYELREGNKAEKEAGNEFFAGKGVENLTNIISSKYERPYGPLAHNKARVGYAKSNLTESNLPPVGKLSDVDHSKTILSYAADFFDPKGFFDDKRHADYLSQHSQMVGSQANVPVNTNNSSQSTHVNIGKVSVNTKATDANGISKDLHTALQNNAKGYNAIRGGK